NSRRSKGGGPGRGTLGRRNKGEPTPLAAPPATAAGTAPRTARGRNRARRSSRSATDRGPVRVLGCTTPLRRPPHRRLGARRTSVCARQILAAPRRTVRASLVRRQGLRLHHAG